MSALSVVIFLCLFFAKSTKGQDYHSPCPNIFQYRNDGGQTYGFIEIRQFAHFDTVTTRANFTIATALPTSYVGKLEPTQNVNELRKNRRLPITYRVHFPVTSPLPRLTSLTANDNILCYGAGDVPGPGRYVTTISLQHILFLKDGHDNGFLGHDSSTHGGFNSGGFDSGGFVQENLNNENKKKPNNIFDYISEDGQVFVLGNFDANSNTNDRFPSFSVIQHNGGVEITSIGNRHKPQTTSIPLFTIPSRPVEVITETAHPPSSPATSSPPTSKPTAPIQCGVSASSQVALIYKGETYERGDWPWLVAIYRRSDGGLYFICSGTLVSERHVVTAAHCMHKKTVLTSTTDIVVKVGAFNLEDWGDDVTVTTTITAADIYKDYDPKTLTNDILVMTLVKSIEYNNYIRPLCLWSGNTDLDRIVGTSGVIAGWGKSELGPGGKGLPRAVKVPIVSTSTCRASKPDFHKLTSSFTLCAGDRNGSGPCLGDSGAGLYVHENNRWQLRGVVSLSLRPENGDNSCNLNEYIVFTDAAQYLPWIQSIIDK